MYNMNKYNPDVNINYKNLIKIEKKLLLKKENEKLISENISYDENINENLTNY